MGKKLVYITPYRNLAFEVLQMYLRKGENAEISAERDESGRPMFAVYIYPM
jgi:hypothetical protein